MSEPSTRAPASRDHFPLLVVAGVVLLGYVTAAVIRAADRGNFADALSTYRADPRGARGLFVFAQESGLPVQRNQRDLELLEPKAQMVLLAVDGAPELEDLLEEALDGGAKADAGLKTIAVFWPSADGGVEEEDGGEPPAREGLNALFVVPISKGERKALLDHVARGATLLYAPSRIRGDELLEELGVSARPSQSAEPVELSPAVPSPFTAEVATVTAPVSGYLDLPATAVPLLDDEQGEVVMGLVLHGKGQVVVLTAPDLASNRWLAQEDNAQLWLSTLGTMAARGTVLFDEYHHGFRSGRSVAEMASRYGLQFAIGQLLLGLCFWGTALRR